MRDTEKIMAKTNSKIYFSPGPGPGDELPDIGIP
jgi:hypothetical protein